MVIYGKRGNEVNGYDFEHKCAELLRRKGYHNVTVTKSSGDQGVDIIAYKGLNKYAIQCKYYSSPVGNKAIQEVYSGGDFYDCDKYIVMTNNTFTKSAKDLARKLNVELWEKCSTSKVLGGTFKVMRILNIISILLGIISFVAAKSFPQALLINRALGVILICAGLFGWFGWSSFILSMLSCFLFFIVGLIMIISSIRISSLDLTDFIPFVLSIFYFIHARSLKNH